MRYATHHNRDRSSFSAHTESDDQVRRLTPSEGAPFTAIQDNQGNAIYLSDADIIRIAHLAQEAGLLSTPLQEVA